MAGGLLNGSSSVVFSANALRTIHLGNEIIASKQPRGIPVALLSRRQSSSPTRLGQPTDHARECNEASGELLVASGEFDSDAFKPFRSVQNAK